MASKENLLVCLLIIIVCCTGCGKKTEEKQLTGMDHATYPAKNISTFAVSEEGRVAASVYNLETRQEEITVYSLDGTIEAQCNLEGISGVQAMAIQETDLYFVSGMPGEIPQFYYMEISGREKHRLCALNGFSEVKRIEIGKDRLYMLADNTALENIDYAYADENDNFTYSGEQILSFDMNTWEKEELPINFPVVFSVMENQNLLINAHDDNGFYFTVYSPANKKFSRKKYRNDLGQLCCLQSVGNQENFLYRDKWLSSKAILYTGTDKKGKQELVPNGTMVYAPGELFYRGGLTFYRGTDCVEMVRNQSYLREEDFSLAVLSQDMDYDLYMLQTRQGVSEHIRDQGAFYPLDEIEPVKELLSACLPYIQEAAINKDNMIWMVPFYVQTNTFVYREGLEEFGLDFYTGMSLEEFLETINSLYIKKGAHDVISVNGNYLLRYLMRRYFEEYPYLDTIQFREMAELLKKQIPFSDGSAIGAFGSDSITEAGESLGGVPGKKRFLGSLETMLMPAIYNTDVHVMEIPIADKKEKTVIDCYFMAVNPSSSHRKSTLAYISSFAKYFLSQKNTMMLEDKKSYTNTAAAGEFYDIYKNGIISFAIPEELYLDDIIAYLSGEKELEEVILESDRKIDIYRKQ